MVYLHGHVCAVGMVDSEVETPKTRFVKPEGGTRTGRPSVLTGTSPRGNAYLLRLLIRGIIIVIYYETVKFLRRKN
jgi:hypothetical protein